MNIVKLHGGLGNQLFQYAFAKALSKKIQQDFSLDLSWYQQYDNRKYELGMFAAHIPIITIPKAKKHLGIWAWFYLTSNKYVVWLRKQIDKIIRLPHLITEARWHQFRHRSESSYYFDGYWQNEKYFTEVAFELKKELRIFRRLISKKAENLLNYISTTESVCVHIRRGDYLQKSPYHVLSADYYRRAMDYCQLQSSKKLLFFIFSDDMNWCQQHLPTGNNNLIFVTGKEGIDLRDEFELMIHCKHHIMANSTLSWWAAWLNPNLQKIVIMPNQWFINKKDFLAHKLIVANWIQFD
jgi:Glycosyl transferase family 11